MLEDMNLIKLELKTSNSLAIKNQSDISVTSMKPKNKTTNLTLLIH